MPAPGQPDLRTFSLFLPMRRNIYNGSVEGHYECCNRHSDACRSGCRSRGVYARRASSDRRAHSAGRLLRHSREPDHSAVDACVFIAFYFEAADRLTSEERQRAIALASRHSSGEKSFTKIVHDGFLTIDFAPFWTSVDERLQRLNAARAQVSMDDEILGGTPIIRGTRVPVYDVAASVAAGNPIERILSSYPSLNREQVELAALFAEANPQRGRPRQRICSALRHEGHLVSSQAAVRSAVTKLLIDECLSSELALMARERGHHETSHVVWIGKSGWKDWELKQIPAGRGLGAGDQKQ